MDVMVDRLEMDTDETESDESVGHEHDELLKTARDRFGVCETAWSEDRKRYIDDIKFGFGEQWPQEALDARGDDRPHLVVDKLGQYIRQIVNDARQNRPSVKVRPVDDAGDPEVATIMQGIIRHIEDRSNADLAYDTALECAVRGGFGYYRILTEYMHVDTFDQDLVIRRIRNPLTVYLDPDFQEPDGSDMEYAFVFNDMPKSEYKDRYGEEYPVDFEGSDVKNSEWYGEHVRVAEYWWVECKERPMHLLEDGTLITQEELEYAQKAGVEDIPAITKTRNMPQRKVKWVRMNGMKVIEGPTDWLGKFIPIIPVYGNEVDIDGKVCHTGLIHGAKDAQRLYNYSRTAYAERVALSPKAPYIAAEGQVEEHSLEWNNANKKSYSVLRYTPIDIGGHPVPPPMRQPASDIPAGFAEDMRLSEHDIQASVGMYNASLGAPSNERTGKAIDSRKKEGDVGTFHYHDNRSRAIRHGGRILVDLIPKIYDAPRIARIVGDDKAPNQAVLDPQQPEAVKRVGSKVIYNLGVGRYDVTVDAGPSYTTLRQEANESMGQLIQSDPSLMQVFGDLWVKNQDWPGASDIADRLKLVLLPQVQQAEQSKGKLPPEVAPIVQQLQQAIQQREQALMGMQQEMKQLQGENETMKAGLMIKQQEVQIQGEETKIKSYEAETHRITAMLNAEAKERDLDLKVEQTVSQRLDALLTKELRTDQ